MLKLRQILLKISKGVIVGLVIVLGTGTLVTAAPGNPASITIGDVAVFRDLLESGDQLWYMRYDVNYATVPTENAENTYLMAIYDTDGTTLLFTRPLNYYQHNIISIYLDATESLVWEGAYVVRVMGNPGVFDPLLEGVNMRSRTLGAGDYREFTDLGGYLLNQAQILEDDLELILLTSGGLLNTTGATLFLAAIPGLNNILPGIFQVTTSYPGVTKVDWNHTYEEELLDRRGEALNMTFNDLSDWLGTSPDWIATGWAGFLSISVGAMVFASTKKPDWAVLFAGVAIPMFVFMGVVNLNLYIIIFFVVLIIFGILFLMGRFA